MSTATNPRARPPGEARAALAGGIRGFRGRPERLYATTGLGLGCPFRTLTGWDCPFCGGTRLGSALLHGDPVAAFWFNPVVFVGLGVLTVLGVLWLVEAAGGPRVRLPGGVAARLRAVRPTAWLLVGLVAAAAYTVLRNLL